MSLHPKHEAYGQSRSKSTFN